MKKIIILLITLKLISIDAKANDETKRPAGFKQPDNFAFEENKGQIKGFDGLNHPEVKFTLKSGSTQIFLFEQGLAYQFTRIHYPKGYQELMPSKTEPDDFEKLQELQKKVRIETFRMDMNLVGANKHAKVTTEGSSKDYTNFYNYNVLDVHSYAKITYHEIYPGIDWVVYTQDKEIKYDFVVHPGADPNKIKMQYIHQEDLKLNKDGSLTLKNSLGEITDHAPISFQNHSEIKTRFVLEDNVITFSLNNYNQVDTLIIDPSLSWATYYGQFGGDSGTSCTTDASGNVYLVGFTNSTASIANSGHQNSFGGGTGDGFLVKFNGAGLRLWATYFGGVGDENGRECCIDPSGNVYMTGRTSSSTSNNIGANGYQNFYGGGISDAYLAKFNSLGVLQWSTYYGGAGEDYAVSCRTDLTGNVCIVGVTTSSNNVASGPFGGFDAFIAKFNSAGVRLWAKFYGGPQGDRGNSCSIDGSGNIYLSGYTTSTLNISTAGVHQTTLNGGVDAFLVMFNSSGVRLWGTYYGGVHNDYSYACSADKLGNVYLAGETQSSSNIASGGHQNTHGGSQDGFLAKFNSAGVRQWGTYYGGTGIDLGFTCSVDDANNVYLSGETQSTIGIASGGYQNTFGGGTYDDFLVKFNSLGVRQWCTYYGGAGWDMGANCHVGITGGIYLTGYTESTTGIAYGGHQNTYGGGLWDAFLVKFCDSPNQPSVISGSSVVCLGTNQTYSVVNDPLSTSYVWGIPSGWSGTSSSNTISLTAGSSGIFSLTANNACGTSLTRTLNVTVNSNPTIAVNNGSICAGQTFTISPSGASTYTIQGGNNTVSPATNSTYTVIGTNSVGCVSSNFAICSVTVNPNPTVTVNSGSICSGQSFTVIPSGANIYTIQGGNYTVSPTTSTSYSIIGANTLGCVSPIALICNVTVNPNPTITVNSGNICIGQSFTMVPAGAFSYSFSSGFSNVNPSSSTSFSVMGTSSLGCISTSPAISSVTVNPLPFITVNSGVICSGQSFTISPSGANAYTIQGGSGVISPTANTTYTVRGISSLGCLSQNTATSDVMVLNNPTITVNSGSICAGKPFLISPTGAITYTIQGGINPVSPIVNDTYTIIGTNTAGCVSPVAATCNVVVFANPTVAANSGSICVGKSFTISTSGANTYTIQGGSNIVSPTTTTTYSIIGTNSIGCISPIAAICTVTVNANPPILISGNTTKMCVGESRTLIANGANSYSWNTASTSSSIVISPSITTSYSVTGTNNNGCFSQVSISQEVDACTMVQEIISGADRMLIYPNPNQGLFIVQLSVASDIEIVNVLGQLILERKLEAGKSTFDLSNMANGVYFVKSKTGNYKIIKE